jgi:hypothetical protein
MDIDSLSGIVHAQLTRAIFEHDPPMPKLWKTAKKEFNYRSSTRELGSIDPAMQIVHEQFHVEFIIVHLAARPFHPPLAKTEDDWLEFLGRGHWLILRSPLIGHRFPNDKPAFLELVEALGQQSRGDLRQRTLKVIEARRPKQKLPNDENRPSFP